MQIKIRVVTNAKKERIIREGGAYKIYTSVPPEKGKANQAIIEILSRHFGVSKSRVKIVKGLKSKDKTVTVDN